jgi:hypothetical protein
MNAPIGDAEYVGERSDVECPVCHANILHVRPEGASPEEEE